MKEKKDLARKIYSSNFIKKYDKDIKLLGEYAKFDSISFINSRIISTILVFIICLFIFNYGYIVGPIVAIIYYYLFKKILITDKINLRRQKLETEALHFFEVLTLSLQTGRNLEEAILVTSSSIDSEISNEFKLVLKELRYGKSMSESLLSMQEKIPSETINNIILTLTESDLFGNSIIETMYNQIDYIRERRKLEVKAEISKVPIKISVVSVVFFIPLILMIVLSPVLIGYLVP